MDIKFPRFNGSKDTRIHTGEDYETITIADIAGMVEAPTNVEKDRAPALIPSTYHSYDARKHAAQAENGMFHILTGDVDQGSPTMAQLKAAIRAVYGDVAFLIYSSKGARADKLKWRYMVPLVQGIHGSDFTQYQEALFLRMEKQGITCDHALARVGQPVFLPNRGEFYEHHKNLKPMLKGVADIAGLKDEVEETIARHAREEAELKAGRERRRAEREALRAANPNIGDNPTEWFNKNYTVEEMFDRYGYERQHRDYKSPQSTSGTYAVRIFDDAWISLSGTDFDSGLGAQIAQSEGTGFCWGDAFDLYCFYEHSNDAAAAWRALSIEMGRDKVQFAEVPEYHLESDDPADYGFEEVSNDPAQDEPRQDEGPAQYPTPYDMFDEAALPPRRFIYGRYYIRGFCSFLASPGGTGKTALQIVEALSIATGRDLLGEKVYEQTNVWMANLEDPIEEMQRRVLAAMRYHRVKPEEVRGRFFMDAGRSLDITFAKQSRDGVIINEAMVEYMRKRIIDLNIGVVMLDPFVGCHDVQENDNGAQNKVMSVIRRLADETNASIVLVHHTRKMNGAAVDVDSIRGAGSLIGAARSARVVNPVSEKRAGELGIDPEQTRGLFEVTDGKNNLTPKSTDAILRRFESVTLDNGDFVGVVAQAKAPGAFHDVTDADVRTILSAIEKGHERDDGSVIGYSTDTRARERWAGNVIIGHEFERLGYIGEDHAKAILRGWTKAGRFTISTIKDHQNRREIHAITEVDMQVGVVS